MANPRSVKASSIKAIMSNPETARRIFSAARSPVGSTKRKTATRILGVVGKEAARRTGVMDGQGGLSVPQGWKDFLAPQGYDPIGPPKTYSPQVTQAKSKYNETISAGNNGGPRAADSRAAGPMSVDPAASTPQASRMLVGANASRINPADQAFKDAEAIATPGFPPGQMEMEKPFSSEHGSAATSPVYKPAPETSWERNAKRLNGTQYSQDEADVLYAACVKKGGSKESCSLRVKDTTNYFPSIIALTNPDFATRKSHSGNMSYGKTVVDPTHPGNFTPDIGSSEMVQKQIRVMMDPKTPRYKAWAASAKLIGLIVAEASAKGIGNLAVWTADTATKVLATAASIGMSLPADAKKTLEWIVASAKTPQGEPLKPLELDNPPINYFSSPYGGSEVGVMGPRKDGKDDGAGAKTDATGSTADATGAGASAEQYGPPAPTEAEIAAVLEWAKKNGGSEDEDGAVAEGSGAGDAADKSIIDQYGSNEISASIEDALAGRSARLDAYYAYLVKNNPAAAEQLRPIIEAVRSGQGASSTVLQLYANPEELAKYMGVSKDYIAQLPYDFLSGPRLADIRSAAEDRYNIENLEAQLLDRTQMHQYASTAFKNYTRSRDQYLGKVDGMMADLNDYMLTADTSDPRTAARMNAYRNYLSGTRNRVQKRYIDIINESLDQENLDYERFNNLYTMHMKRAEQLIADTNASATNAYNTVVPLITQSITEAYNFVEQMRDSANGMTSLEFELSAAAEDLKAKGLSNTLTQANIDQTEAETQNIKDGKNADGSTPGGKTDKVSASAVEDSAYFNDGDSWIYADPDTLVQFAKDKNYDVGELSRAYVGAASKDIKARAAEGSLELANQFLGGAAALADTEYDEAYSAYFELTTAAYVGGLSEFFASVRTSLNKIIEKQLDGKYDSQEEFKSALKNSLPSVDDAFADALYAALNDEYSDEERKKILTDNSVLATRILWVYGNSLGLLEEASA